MFKAVLSRAATRVLARLLRLDELETRVLVVSAAVWRLAQPPGRR